jgi:hypothetical protein
VIEIRRRIESAAAYHGLGCTWIVADCHVDRLAVLLDLDGFDFGTLRYQLTRKGRHRLTIEHYPWRYEQTSSGSDVPDVASAVTGLVALMRTTE